MKKLYFASPLFSEMEKQFNESIVHLIRTTYKNLEVYLPQEAQNINDKNLYADSKMIATYDTKKVLESDLLFAVLDGQVIDPGVASEIGVAYQAGIPIIGLYTDSRQMGSNNPEKIQALNKIGENQFSYINLYTVGLIKLNGEIYNKIDDAIANINTFLEVRNED